ncbi:MAG: lysylphosphatidylglycerol synthase transmembrane domain-containing protein [Candidatus Sedimenticola sp. (ex Thyasira tokunagai)]
MSDNHLNTAADEGRLSSTAFRLRDWIIGGAILVALLLWVHFAVGWGPLLQPWQSISLSSIAVLLLLSFASYLLRAIRIQAYFPELLQGRFLTTLRLSILHNFANNLLPMRAGEALFPILMRRHFGTSMTDSTFSLIWIRLLDLHVITGIALLSLILATPEWWWIPAIIVWMIALPLVLLLRETLKEHLGNDKGWQRLLHRIVDNAPPDGGRMSRIYLLTLLSWGSKFVAFAMVLQHFLPLPLWQSLAGIIGAELSSVLPFHGIAGAGSYEVAMLAVLAPLGVNTSDALNGAVNLHLFLLGVTLLLGVASLLLPVREPLNKS